MDRDFDGRLSFEEFMGEVTHIQWRNDNTNISKIYSFYIFQESIIEKLFKNMDKNGDGVVTKEVNIKQDFKAQIYYNICFECNYKYYAKKHWHR